MQPILTRERGESDGTSYFHLGDGFCYHVNKYVDHNGADGCLYLRCVHNKTIRACRGTCIIEETDGEVFVRGGTPHTCQPDPFRAADQNLRHNLLDAVRNDANLQPTAALRNARLQHSNPEVAQRLTWNRVRSSIRRVRMRHHPNLPHTFRQIAAILANPRMSHLTASLDKQDSLYRGIVGPEEHQSLVFFSKRSMKYMRKVKVVFCDGTFSSRPGHPDSRQVLLLSTVRRNTVIPLVVCLMESKSQQAYEAVLTALRRAMPRFRPQRVVCDFEPSEMNAWQNIFACKVQGCYWHFCRAVCKRASELGLRGLMEIHPPMASILRSCCALALLPKPLMQTGLLSLVQEAQGEGILDLMAPFFKFMLNTWLTGWRFEKVSVFLAKHRTNNVAESINKMLSKRTGVHRPSLWGFIDAVRKVEYDAHLDVLSLDVGLAPRGRRRIATINNDARILNNISDLLTGHINVNRFLHLASTRVFNIFNDFMGVM